MKGETRQRQVSETEPYGMKKAVKELGNPALKGRRLVIVYIQSQLPSGVPSEHVDYGKPEGEDYRVGESTCDAKDRVGPTMRPQSSPDRGRRTKCARVRFICACGE